MPDALAALFLEQDRMRPTLDRLLALAALWMDPVAPAEAPHGADAAKPWRFAGPAGDGGAAPLPEVAAAAAIGTAPRDPAAPRAAPPAAPLSATAPAGVADGIVGIAGFGTGHAAVSLAADAPVAATPSILPMASLKRLRERGAARSAAGKAASPMPVIAVPGAARTSPFAALVASAGADVLAADDASPPPVPLHPARDGTRLTASRHGGALAAPAATPPGGFFAAAAVASPGILASGTAAGPSRGVITGSVAAEPPGDALEERLADILERAAAEAGIALP